MISHDALDLHGHIMGQDFEGPTWALAFSSSNRDRWKAGDPVPPWGRLWSAGTFGAWASPFAAAASGSPARVKWARTMKVRGGLSRKPLQEVKGSSPDDKKQRDQHAMFRRNPGPGPSLC